MYANGLRSTGRYVWSPVLQSGGVGEIVFVFMRHGPCCSWEKNAASSVVEALQCRQNADMPITEVMVVTNDKRRQLDNSIAVM